MGYSGRWHRYTDRWHGGGTACGISSLGICIKNSPNGRKAVRTTKNNMSIQQATYELVKENNMLLKAIYQKLLENESNDFQTNVAANIFADMIYGKRR